MNKRLVWVLTDLFVLIIGLLSLLSPFIFPQSRAAAAQGAAFPVMVSLVIVLCLFIVIFEAQSSVMDSKMIAFLGILVAINAGIRFLENAIPGPAGFSPTFFLIILAGYTFGSRIGFLMGAMTMFVSALITGGVGPWLPGQMITAGWVGQTSALLKIPIQKLGWCEKPIEIVLLAVLGAGWGLLYGVIMNLWFWPFLAATPGQVFTRTASLTENVQRYAAYYLATSLVWDVTRAVGNVLVISVMAKPVLKILTLFLLRLTLQHSEPSSS